MEDKQKYVFSSTKRYMTKGVQSEIPIDVQLKIWQCIDDLVKSNTSTDYLQVFTLDTNNDVLEVTHTQEVPEYKSNFTMNSNNKKYYFKNKKIFVIDDVTHCTMLLANEY